MIESTDQQLAIIIARLEKAHTSCNKSEILQIYKDAKTIALEMATEQLFEEYDKWVDRCNDLLYS